ncbi:hypothetical protein [Rufibacter ruber]|uniref:hypothetical protein n=1 Tax=Rufibacter ruber TaxID=1783499 RepID=UPI0008336B54|nr:hypothetical protein [Rufibacter ruber]
MQKIITEKIGDKLIVLLQGDVNAADVRLSRRLQPPRTAPLECHLWIDCASIQCVKTHGFCHFINQLLLLKSPQVKITLLNMSPLHQKLLQAMHLTSFFSVLPDFEEAYHMVQAC